MGRQSLAFGFLLFVCASLVSVKSEEFNSCKTYKAYFNRNSHNCFYSSDFYKHPPELSEKYTGKSETHFVLTEDGYNLTIFRMPKENPKGVIILQHPISADARIWLIQFNESSALFLWEAGYDIWMPNNRGTYYSRNHVNLTRDDKEFWNFSFHEVGIYDHPACIDYIRSKTNGSKVILINHSMGASSTLIYAALKRYEAAEAVQLMVQMSPAAILNNIRAPGVKTIAIFANILHSISNILGIYSLMDYDSVFLTFIRPYFIKSPFQFLLNYIVNSATGWTPDDADPKFYNMLAAQFPSEFSIKCYIHFGQIIKDNGRFQMFDYGSEKNMQIYNSTIPLKYPLGDIRVPQMLIYSKDDTIATVKDSKLLYKALPLEARHGQLEIEGVNHLTFQLSKNRIQKIYRPILRSIMEIRKDSS